LSRLEAFALRYKTDERTNEEVLGMYAATLSAHGH
jgi:hypothetical protein